MAKMHKTSTSSDQRTSQSEPQPVRDMDLDTAPATMDDLDALEAAEFKADVQGHRHHEVNVANALGGLSDSTQVPMLTAKSSEDVVDEVT